MKRTHVTQSSATAANTPDFLFSQARGDLAAVMASISATRG